jgi:hypothetical protein
MNNPQQELVWEGRAHLGDEPGLFGDASYSGLAIEFPITLSHSDPGNPDPNRKITLTVDVEYVKTFEGYPGHRWFVVGYTEDPNQQYHYKETELKSGVVKGEVSSFDAELELPKTAATSVFLSLRIRVDTSVAPGLYDDFIIKRISLVSENFAFVAALGFH